MSNSYLPTPGFTLNQSLDHLAPNDPLREKYHNAIAIIGQYQNTISVLKANLQSQQEAIRNQEGIIQSLGQNGGAQEIMKLRDEKNRMQLSMDRLKLQLEQKKT